MPARPVRKSSRKPAEAVNARANEIAGLILIALGIFFVLCIFTEAAGIVGAFIKPLLFGLFGILAFASPIIMIASGVLIIMARSRAAHLGKLVTSLFLIVFFTALLQIFWYDGREPGGFFEFVARSYEFGVDRHLGGGAIGALPLYPALILFGEAGAYIFFTLAVVICIIILTNLSVKKVGEKVGSTIKAKVEEGREARAERRRIQIFEESRRQPPELDPPWEQEPRPVFAQQSMDEHQSVIAPPPKGRTCAAEPKAKEPEQPVIMTKAQHDGAYIPPSITLLKKPAPPKASGRDDAVQNARLLEETLLSFNIPAKVKQITRGPAVTRYELHPEQGIKVSRIVNLANDIALSLAATEVRIEAPIPGKAAVGIEVPNKVVSMVSIREVLESAEFIKHKSPVAFALGKDIGNVNIVADIEKMPHLLIAGTTGSGKSVCINNLIVSVLMRSSPEQVKMVMIDPKMVELVGYNGIPHLYVPVVTDSKKAAGALRWALNEMEMRYAKFSQAGVRQLSTYNESAEERLPRVLVIVDELADLMMVAPQEVEELICRIAQKGRAAGIHLVLATQRPSANVVTGLIKANVPSRIAFNVYSNLDSRIILDMPGAEKLLGRGDMLYHPIGEPKPIRVQGAFIDDDEVAAITDYLREMSEVEYSEDIIEAIESGGQSESAAEKEDYDELLPDAAKIFLDRGEASISLLQRRMRVGYARAARLVDQMEQMGIVSGQDGSKPRNVLIGTDDYERIFGGGD